MQSPELYAPCWSKKENCTKITQQSFGHMRNFKIFSWSQVQSSTESGALQVNKCREGIISCIQEIETGTSYRGVLAKISFNYVKILSRVPVFQTRYLCHPPRNCRADMIDHCFWVFFVFMANRCFSLWGKPFIFDVFHKINYGIFASKLQPFVVHEITGVGLTLNHFFWLTTSCDRIFFYLSSIFWWTLHTKWYLLESIWEVLFVHAFQTALQELLYCFVRYKNMFVWAVGIHFLILQITSFVLLVPCHHDWSPIISMDYHK